MVAAMGSCVPLLVVFSWFAMMAPKGKSKANAKATGKRTRDEDDDEGAKALVKVEKDARGQYPAIPTDELNKLNSRLNNLKAQGIMSPAEEFRAKSRIEKRDWFWEKYRFNKDILYVRRKETQNTSFVQTATNMEGKVTKWKIAELNGIIPGVPDYLAKVDALVADLASEPHPTKALADLGELVYHYTHEKMKESSDVHERSSALGIEADVDKSSYKHAAEDMGVTIPGSSSSSADVTIADWKQQWMDLMKEAEKETLKNRRAADEGEHLLYRLKLDVDNKLFQVMVSEAAAKVDGFVTLSKAYSQTLVDLNSQANSAEQALVSTKTLSQVRDNLESVRSSFKAYMDKVKKFTGM